MTAIFSSVYDRLKNYYTEAVSKDLLERSAVVARLSSHTVILGLAGKTVSMGLVVCSVAIAVLFTPFVSTAGFIGVAFKVWFFGNLARVSENLIQLGCNPGQVIGGVTIPMTNTELVGQLFRNSNNIKTALKANTAYFDLGIEFCVDSALFAASYRAS